MTCNSQNSPVLSDELLRLYLGPPLLHHKDTFSVHVYKRISHLKSHSLRLEGPSARAISSFEKKGRLNFKRLIQIPPVYSVAAINFPESGTGAT